MGGFALPRYPQAMLSVLLFLAVTFWTLGTILLIVHVRMAPLGVQDAFGFRMVSGEESRLERHSFAHLLRAW